MLGGQDEVRVEQFNRKVVQKQASDSRKADIFVPNVAKTAVLSDLERDSIKKTQNSGTKAPRLLS